MADVSLMAVPSERDAPTCANCGAELVADQRYCLACGHPVSPVRLAFLDVLSEERPPSQGLYAPATIEAAAFAYGPAAQPGLGGWLRRNTGLLSLLAVLLLCLIAGLLVGHWVTQNGKTPVASGTSTVKIEGLGALATPTSTSSTTTSSTAGKTASSSTSAKAAEEEEAKEAAEEEKKAPALAKPKEVSPAKLEKLSHTTGKKHEEEVNALGDTPLETH